MRLNEKLISAALNEYGVASIKGARHSDRVRLFLSQIGLGATDNDAWCSAFMAWLFFKITGLAVGKANARSWTKVQPIGLHTVAITDCLGAQPGDVVVLWRVSPTSWKGHVGLFVRATKRHVWLLGGNQSGGRVSIKRYPIKRVLVVRRFFTGAGEYRA